jgi:lipid-binding SYLF domain-containing protein
MEPLHFNGPTDEELYDEPASHKPVPQGQPQGQAQEQAEAGGSKNNWSQRLSGLGSKVAGPFNALANKLGSEAFLPMTMDKECEKAARILRGFCSKSSSLYQPRQKELTDFRLTEDGIFSDGTPQTLPSQTAASPGSTPAGAATTGGPTTSKPVAEAGKPAGSKSKVLLTIPSKVIARAQGLAIFTTVRAGFHVTGSSGSGILVARLPDGSWSPPSGISVHSLGGGFVVGMDIYDCVVVINSAEALRAFTSTRMSLGSDLAVTAGPWGAGGAVDFGLSGGADKEKATDPAAARPGRDGVPAAAPPAKPGLAPPASTNPTTSSSAPQPAAASSSKDRKPSPFREGLKKPVYSYVKSRGLYVGVQVDGTVVTERKEANAAFYGESVTVNRILAGDVRPQSGPHQWPAAARMLIEVLKGAEGWRGQPTTPTAAGSSSIAGGVTAGVAGMNLGGAAPSPPPPNSKAAEAAAEARTSEDTLDAAPPSYAEPIGEVVNEELPPAYVDDGHARPGAGDTKTAPH